MPMHEVAHRKAQEIREVKLVVVTGASCWGKRTLCDELQRKHGVKVLR